MASGLGCRPTLAGRGDRGLVIAVEEIEDSVVFRKPVARHAIDEEKEARLIRRLIRLGQPDRLARRLTGRGAAMRQPIRIRTEPERGVERRQPAPRCRNGWTARCFAARVRPSNGGNAWSVVVRVRW